MPNTAAVGLSGQRAAASLLQPLRELFTSSQLLNAGKLFLLGATVSWLRTLGNMALQAVRRVFFSHALIRGGDEAHRWVMDYLMRHTDMRTHPRNVQVSAVAVLPLRGRVVLRPPSAELEKDEFEGIFFFPVENGTLHFRFNGYHVWASRGGRYMDAEVWNEDLSLAFLTLSSRTLKEFIAACKKGYNEHERGKCKIYTLSTHGGHWHGAPTIVPQRRADSVLLPARIKQRMLDDARRFLRAETGRWYADRGIPYRRGMLLHGAPGAGKTSMVHVLASELGMPIYNASLAARHLDDAAFLELMRVFPPNAIVLLEDVDAAFVKRDDAERKGGGVSFSTLLNAIDGVGAAEGRILVLTTNHRERLDEALIRPGRIDLQLEFQNATRSQAYDLFVRWFPSAPRPASLPSAAVGEEEAQQPQQQPEDATDARAAHFAACVPEQAFSVAALQGFLLSCMDGDAAAAGIEEWVRASLRDGEEATREKGEA